MTDQPVPTIEELEQDLRRAVELWGDDCSDAEALRKIIKQRKIADRRREPANRAKTSTTDGGGSDG